jgi:phosphomannomutase
VALLLTYLALRGGTLSEAAGALPSYAIVKAKLPLDGIDGDALLARAAEEMNATEIDRTDGLKLLWPARQEWLHLRKSGTEPIVRIIAEAPDAEAAARLVDRARRLAAG